MGRPRMRLLAILLPCFLTACSGPDLVNALVPEEGYRVVRDLAYAEGPRGRLDLYVPEGAAEGAPTVIFYYGGNWQSGSKEDYLFVGEAFASRGYQTAIPDYRLYPEVRFPAFLEDAAAAAAWVEAEAGRAGVEAGPIFLVGHSAGAYIAAMLTLEPRWLASGDSGICDRVAAMAGLAGPYDFLPLKSDDLKDIFGPEPSRARTQPINHVDGAAPPMLLVSGRDDLVVSPGNAERLAAKIRDRGGTVEERYYEDTGHIALVASLADPLRWVAPALEDLDRFFRRHARAGGNLSCRS